MVELIKLAWRNIWRNKRRSLITIASIFFAVFFAVVMRSIQLGSYGHMIKQSIENFSGYLQIQNPEYFDEQSLDNSLEYTPELIETLNKLEDVKIAVPRIEGFVLASSGHQSKGVIVTGIDTQKEKHASNPENNLVRYILTPKIVKEITTEFAFDKKTEELLWLNQNTAYTNIERIGLDLDMNAKEFSKYEQPFKDKAYAPGQYLTANDSGALVSSKLANFLNIQVGDTIIMIGSGYHGSSAAGLFPVRGIIKVLSPELDNKLIYITLSRAQQFFDMHGRITSIAINIDNTDQMLSVQNNIQHTIDNEKYTVKNWEQINPVLKQQIESDDKSGQMFVGILYFIVFFGILGTVMMMIAERKREFGVLVAIGMRKRKLSAIVIVEMLFIGIVGTLSGLLAAVPLVIAFNLHPVRFTGETGKTYEEMGFDPIMPTAPIDHYFTWQAVIILIMVLLACYIPLWRIRKMKIMNSLRG